ncbi:hypothetical protein B7C42_08303 [Nocardia cerradoensis]|uniref:Uncharacterized protein n=1 Tax=Nocardia cerradoensis TaxID=85688 RepID=A0A231GSM4_9NOCA|nr:hypothetical protein B7C42_08303 [Nocardia cerradoensis]
MDGERAGVDVADRVDQAHHPPGPAQVQSGDRGGPERVEVEERVSGQDALAVGDEPVVDLQLLVGGGVQFVPYVGAASGRAQPGDAQLGSESVGDGLEFVELVHVVAGHHDRDLEVLEPGVGEVAHGPHRGIERSGTAHRVVDLGGGAVDGDLHIHVIGGREPAGSFGGEPNPVGGELDSNMMGDRVVEQFPEVAAHGGFAAADVDVEDLHAFQLVDERLALGGRQLSWVAAARRGQAVLTRQIAGVGEFPGQADRGVEAVFEMFDQLHR